MIGGKGATTTGVLPGSEAAVLARIPCRGKGYLKGAWCSERKEFRKRRTWQPVKNKLPTDQQIMSSLLPCVPIPQGPLG